MTSSSLARVCVCVIKRLSLRGSGSVQLVCNKQTERCNWQSSDALGVSLRIKFCKRQHRCRLSTKCNETCEVVSTTSISSGVACHVNFASKSCLLIQSMQVTRGIFGFRLCALSPESKLIYSRMSGNPIPGRMLMPTGCLIPRKHHYFSLRNYVFHSWCEVSPPLGSRGFSLTESTCSSDVCAHPLWWHLLQIP